MIIQSRLRLGLLLAGLVVAAPGVADAKTITLRIGAGHPAGAIWIAAVRDYFIPKVAERVAKETGDTIRWTEAWGGSVCKLGECLEAVESGLLDIADVETAFEPAKLISHNFTYFFPFGAGDPRVAVKAVNEVYEKTPALRKILEDRYSQMFIGAGVVGNYGLVTSFKWNSVADLKGHKIAAAGPNLPWLEGTGAVGVQSNLNEAYTSFQTGVYEGWVMFPDAIASFKLNEVTKQYIDLDFGCMHTPLLTMNKDTWRDLSPAIQKIFLEVGREWADHLGRVTYEKQQEALKRLKDQGLEVRQADAAAKTAWAKALPNIPKQRAAEIDKAGQPGDAVFAYGRALKAAGVSLPRDWESEK